MFGGYQGKVDARNEAGFHTLDRFSPGGHGVLPKSTEALTLRERSREPQVGDLRPPDCYLTGRTFLPRMIEALFPFTFTVDDMGQVLLELVSRGGECSVAVVLLTKPAVLCLPAFPR